MRYRLAIMMAAGLSLSLSSYGFSLASSNSTTADNTAYTSTRGAPTVFNNWHIKPVLTLSAGLASAEIAKNQVVSLVPGLTNTYVPNQGYKSKVAAGLFAGGEFQLTRNTLMQLGLGYYRSGPFNVSGTIFQFSDPNYNNLAYTYKVSHQRLVVEGSLLANAYGRLHPYVTGSIGAASNASKDYSETALNPVVIPGPPFGNKTVRSMTAGVGIGALYDLTPHIRLGAGYQFTDIGKAQFAPNPAQTTADTVGSKNIYEHELILKVSLLGN